MTSREPGGDGVLARLDAALGLVCDAVSVVGSVDAGVAVDVVDRLARLEAAVAACQAAALGLVVAAGVPREDGASSATAWLADRAGLPVREAARRAKRARLLGGLPGVAAALAAGDIGVAQADRVSDAAADGTFGSLADTEAALLPAAVGASADEFARAVRDQAAAVEADRADRDAGRAFARREVRFVHHRDGTVGFRGRLPTTDGTLFEQTVQAMTTPDPAGTPDGLLRTPGQRRADGLIDLVKAAVACGAPPETGGLRPHLHVLVPADGLVAAGEPQGPAAPQAVPGAPDTAVPSRNTSRAADPGRTPSAREVASPAELLGHGPLARRALRRLGCDAAVTRIVTAGAAQVLDVGRATRVWPTATRKAVLARDRHCRFPGCDRPPAWCDAHHVIWWENGGPTNVGNGVLLCGFHHHLVHDAGWHLDMDPDTAVVTVHNPTGRIERTSHPPGFQPPPVWARSRPSPAARSG